MFTQRRLVYILTIAIILASATVDFAAAKRGKSGKKASTSKKSSANKKVGAKSRRERGRKELTRKQKRRGRAEVATRRGRRRQAAISRRSREPNEAQETAAPAAPKPAASSISDERVTEIQDALIKLGYMEGPASGHYDDATIDAMRRFQSASGFSATGFPSALTLKKLGVSKDSRDGYAVPVKSVSEKDKRPD